MQREKTRRGRSPRASSARRLRTAGWMLLGLAAGLGLGWLFGSLTGCLRTRCEPRLGAIEATGTWVGGLGTIARSCLPLQRSRVRSDIVELRRNSGRKSLLTKRPNAMNEQLRRERVQHADEILKQDAAEAQKATVDVGALWTSGDNILGFRWLGL